MTGLRIYLTGSIYLERDDVLLNERCLPGKQGRIAFAMLAIERQRSVSRDELIEELWPETPPPSADRALSAIISRLRGVLENIGMSGNRLVSGFGQYQLRLPSDVWVDAEAALASIDRAESAWRSGDLRQVWSWACPPYYIARRTFLSGADGPWATRTRAELRSVHVRSAECLGEGWLANGESTLAARLAAEVLALDPFRETGYQLLMRAHAAAGNRAEALRVYEQCQRLLADELGVPPSPQTEAHYLDILRL